MEAIELLGNVKHGTYVDQAVYLALREMLAAHKRHRRDNWLIQKLLSQSREFNWKQADMIDHLRKQVTALEEELAFNDEYYKEME